MRAFGARGYVSPEQLKKTASLVRALRRDRVKRERQRIAALSNQDIARIMARTIVERVRAAAAVEMADFLRAGIPAHRIEKNRDAAMRQARKLDPSIDQALAMPVAA
jgi:hypothetical protein